MKIVRAMKKIARLKGEIKDLKNRMELCLNTQQENEFDEDYNHLKDRLFIKIKEMIYLKAMIMKANVTLGMFPIIVNLGELKSYMDYLKELDPKVGKRSNSRYSDESSIFKSQLSVRIKNDEIINCQKMINELTDKLDEFNAITDIEEDKIDIELFK